MSVRAACFRRDLREAAVDLATATITAGATTYRRNRDTAHESIERAPTPIARDPATGRGITIPLSGVGPAQQPLRPCPGGRAGDQAPVCVLLISAVFSGRTEDD